MSVAAELLVAAIAGIALILGGWWALLALLALPRPGALPAPRGQMRLTVIVPAHDEEAGIASCLRSLAAASCDPRPELLVVADNCSDATAAVAAAHGATVLERDDPEHRGKGYALEFAIRHLDGRDSPPHAVLFVDADTEVSENLYEAVARRIKDGALAVQVHYAAGPGTTALARLRRLAFMLIHWARPLGAARLGLGTTIKGNGMALRWDVARLGLGSVGITEDAAMTLALARRGIAVAFEPRAWVRGDMAGEYRAARTQDERWERGRIGLLPEALWTAAAALARARIACCASALEVASPALSMVGLGALCALLAALALGSEAGAWLAACALASLVAYVAIGLAAARAPLRDIAALWLAPRFVAHKVRVFAGVLSGRAARSWQRTERP